MKTTSSIQTVLIFPEDAKAILDSYLPTFREVFKWALQELMSLHQTNPQMARDLSTRAKATIVNDMICGEIERKLTGNEHIRVLRINGFLCLLIQNKLLVRFKKLDRQGGARNYQTRFQVQYNEQLPMPDVPDQATRINAGYILNPLHTQFEDLRVTCPHGKNLAWQFSFWDTGFQATIRFLDHPIEETETQVRIKKGAQSKKASG